MIVAYELVASAKAWGNSHYHVKIHAASSGSSYNTRGCEQGQHLWGGHQDIS
jgi:hypothetical protein